MALPPMAANCLPVVLVPGIGGSELRIDGQKVWLRHSHAFLGSDIPRLALPGPAADAYAVLQGPMFLDPFDASFYRPWVGLLREKFGYVNDDIHTFPYDWRQDNRESAQRLHAFLLDRFTQYKKRFAILAHSNGGLVARYCVQVLGGNKYVDKLITVGTPHRGSLDALKALVTGEEVFPPNWLTKLWLAPLCRDAIRTFPSAYQLLADPVNVTDINGSRVGDLLSPGNSDWCDWGRSDLIDDARRFKAEIARHTDTLIYSIYGFDQPTVTSVQLRSRSSQRWKSPDWRRTKEGDNRVWRGSAQLNSDLSCPSGTTHGRLPRTKVAIEKLRTLLCEPITPEPIAPTPGPALELDLGEGVFQPGAGITALVALYSPNGQLLSEVELILEVLNEYEEGIESIKMKPGFSRDQSGRYWAEFRAPDTAGGYVARLSVTAPAELRATEPIEAYFGVIVEEPDDLRS